MKKILFLLLFLVSINASGQKWYVATTGSDSHGKGTLVDPWLTVKHAADTIIGANGFAGDTIMIAAGNYTISTQVILDNVSLMGAGVTSVLTSTITGSPYYAIKAASTEGTIVNQSISYIKIVGGGTAYSPLGISGRSGVEVHHCTFENFVDRGVCFSGTTDFTSAKPTIFATNNSFHDNTITNCASGVSYSRGNLNIGGQSGMIIYNNTINQTDRSLGVNGFGIKAMYYGYNKGVKIYNNYIYVPPKVGSDWCFGIEMLHNLGGIEIYNNEVFGAIDISATTPPGTVYAATDEGGYGFALKIYGNTVGHTTLCVGTQVGIDLEHDIIGGTYIYRNHIRNVYKGIALTMSGNMTDINIYYNLIDSIGYEGVTQGQGIGFTGTGSMDNLNVWNNVILGHPDEATLSGMYKIVSGNVTNSSIRNNIFRYFDDAPMDFENATFNTVSIENNIFYNNGSSNNITWTGTSQTDVTEQNNYKVDPLFIGGSPYSYKLQETSPAKDAGISVGLTSDYGGYSVPIGALPDIGAWEYGADITPPNWTPQGIGWDRMYQKLNFRDSINFTRGFMIAGVPISASGSGLEILGGLTASVDDLNATAGATGNFQGQINSIVASTVDDSKADTSLSNLASVAINTHLLPGTDGAVNLGSATKKFGDIYQDSAKSINWNNGDVTLIGTANKLTMAGGTLDLPSGVHRIGTDTIAVKSDITGGGGTSYAWIDSANYYTKEFNIIDYGAVSGGTGSDAAAIQAAINAAFATITDVHWFYPDGYGAKVIIPAGEWYIDVADTLKSFIEIDISQGAVFTFPVGYTGEMWVNIEAYPKDEIWNDTHTRLGGLSGAFVHGGTYIMATGADFMKLTAHNVWQFVSFNKFADFNISGGNYGIFMDADTCSAYHEGVWYSENGWNNCNHFSNIILNLINYGVYIESGSGHLFDKIQWEVGTDTAIYIDGGGGHIFSSGKMGDFGVGGCGVYIAQNSAWNYFNIGDITGTRRIDNGYDNTFVTNGTIYAGSTLSATSNAGSAGSGPQVVLQRKDGLTIPFNVENGAELGEIRFDGYYTSAYYEGAAIRAFVNGGPGAGDMPSSLGFYVSPDGSSTATRRINIADDLVYFTNPPVPNATDGSVSLGNTNRQWGQLNLYTGKGIYWNAGGAGQMGLLHAAGTPNTLTLSGGNLALGANELTQTAGGNYISAPASTSTVTTQITSAMLSRFIYYSEAAASDLTGNDPQIADGSAGQIITIIGSSDTNTLTLNDGDGLRLTADWIGGIGDTITLVYNATIGDWLEISRANN